MPPAGSSSYGGIELVRQGVLPVTYTNDGINSKFSDFMLAKYRDKSFQPDGVKLKDDTMLMGENMEQNSTLYNQGKEIFWSSYADWAIRNPVLMSGWVDEFVQTSSAEIFSIFPIKFSKEAKFYRTQIKFEPMIEGPSVRNVPGRMISYGVEQESGNSVYTGQGFEIDYTRFRLPGGMEEFDIKVSAVVSDIWLMIIYSAMMEFQSTPSIYNIPQKVYPNEDVPLTIEKMFEYERTQFGALNKKPQAINNVIARVSNIMEQNKMGPADRILMTKDCYYYVTVRDESNIDYQYSGGQAITNRASGVTSVSTVHGIKPIFVQLLEPELHAESHDSVLRHIVTNGGMTVFNARYLNSTPKFYRAQDRKIKFSSWTQSKLEEHCFMHFLHHCPEFIPTNSQDCRDGEQGSINYKLLVSLANSAAGINKDHPLNPFVQTRTEQRGNEQKLHQFLTHYTHRIDDTNQVSFYNPVRKIGEIHECHLKTRYLQYTVNTLEHQLKKVLTERDIKNINLFDPKDKFTSHSDVMDATNNVENSESVTSLDKLFTRLSDVCKDNVLGLSFIAAKHHPKASAYIEVMNKIYHASKMFLVGETASLSGTVIETVLAATTNEFGQQSVPVTVYNQVSNNPSFDKESRYKEAIPLFDANFKLIDAITRMLPTNPEAAQQFLTDNPQSSNTNFLKSMRMQVGSDIIEGSEIYMEKYNHLMKSLDLNPKDDNDNILGQELMNLFVNMNGYALAQKIVKAWQLPFIKRVAAFAVLLQNITLNGLQSWHDNDIALPFGGRCFRPFETQFMESAIIIAAGPIGTTYFSGLDNTVGFDQGFSHFTMQFFTYFKVWIDNRGKFCIAPFIRGLQALGGKGNKYINDHPNLGGVLQWNTEAWTDCMNDAFGDMEKSVGEKLGDFSIIPVLQSLNNVVDIDFNERHLDVRGFWDRNDYITRLDECESFADKRNLPMYDNQFLVSHLFPQFTTQMIQPQLRNSANFDAVAALRRVNYGVHQTTQFYVNPVTKDWEEVISSHYWDYEGDDILGKQTSAFGVSV